MPIPFVVDTGAALTCIHAMDAIRGFGLSPHELDPTSWSNTQTIGGVGGSHAYRTEVANYGFRKSDGQVEVIPSTVRIGEIRSQSTPALLGWDLLKFFRLEINGPNQTIALYRV